MPDMENEKFQVLVEGTRHITHNTPTIDYDGPEADSILSRGLSQWQVTLRLCKVDSRSTTVS